MTTSPAPGVARLTGAQRSVLRRLVAINDAAGRPAHEKNLSTNRGVLERLAKAGLLVSHAPFSFAFHHVEITSAGRAALQGDDHG